MPRLYSHRDRPVHLGPLPAGRLARDPAARPLPATQPADREPAGPDSVGEALAEYLAIFKERLIQFPNIHMVLQNIPKVGFFLWF